MNEPKDGSDKRLAAVTQPVECPPFKRNVESSTLSGGIPEYENPSGYEWLGVSRGPTFANFPDKHQILRAWRVDPDAHLGATRE